MNQIFTGTVGYLEDRLRGEIDYDELAKKVYANKFTVMRVFLAMTGLSVGEYVRARRLTEAGREIVSTKKKIIDIALDFGYGTPESFTKAFTRFNGFSPDHSRPELLRIHWTPRARISERRLELYIPVLGEPLSAKEEKGESPCASRLTGVRPDPSGG